jgi:flagellar protein FlaG
MEISNSVKSFGVSIDSSGAAKAAASPGRRSDVAADSRSVEIKAPPKVIEFEPADLDKAIADLQKYVEGLGRNLSFRRDESIDRSIITVRDATTNKLVRQIPAEEVVAIARDIKRDVDANRVGMLLRGNV